MTTLLLPLKILIISFVLHCSDAATLTKVLLPQAAEQDLQALGLLTTIVVSQFLITLVSHMKYSNCKSYSGAHPNYAASPSYSVTTVMCNILNCSYFGAVCLDGTPPAYYLHSGTTTPNKWIFHLEGGAWCPDEDDCVERSKTRYGSSDLMPETQYYSGLLSDDCKVNPHFCGWSMMYASYCDGASFAGNVDDPVVWEGTTLYFRGFRILDAVIDALLEKNIEEIILTGCSAGGLAAIIHVDYFRSKIPKEIPVYAIPDAGYFIDAPNVNGEMIARTRFQDVFNLHNCIGGVNQDCVANYPEEEWKCFFPQYTFPYITTPIFLLNARYDSWQVLNNLELGCLPSKSNCTDEQMVQFYKFGREFMEAVNPVIESPTSGVFIDSCVVHCQTIVEESWTEIMVEKQTMGDTFYYWLTGTANTTQSTKVVDCDYPCNPTCVGI